MGDDTPADSASVSERARTAVRTSRFCHLWKRAAATVRDSYLYRWLTAEPEPEVIVIDLRETWTVGPVIRLLDAVLDRVLPALDDSRLATAGRAAIRYTLAAPAVVGGLVALVAGLGLGLVSVAGGTVGPRRLGLAIALVVTGIVATRERRRWAELRETRPVRLVVAALEPPAPPAHADSSEPAETDAETRDTPEHTTAPESSASEPAASEEPPTDR